MQPLPKILPHEGCHVIHLFFRIEYEQWHLLDAQKKIQAKASLKKCLEDIQATPKTQLLVFSVVTPKADLGFMLLTPDLQVADCFAKRIALALGPKILTSVLSWLSMTERSEYTPSEEEYSRTLEIEEGIPSGSPAHVEKLDAFRVRIAKYLNDRLYPNLPSWPVLCFYPMSKRRVPGQNWYALDYNARKKLMGGHARVGRAYAGRVLQLITGSSGLDSGEWGVTLFAQTTSEIKSIIYEMRFDEVSAVYAEFGDFFIGIQMPLDPLYERLCL